MRVRSFCVKKRTHLGVSDREENERSIFLFLGRFFVLFFFPGQRGALNFVYLGETNNMGRGNIEETNSLISALLSFFSRKLKQKTKSDIFSRVSKRLEIEITSVRAIVFDDQTEKEA